MSVLHDEWAVHQPEALDAPIPGRVWYSGCEPGGDRDSETGRYDGQGPRINPFSGICEGCGEIACRTCGRESCPDHPVAVTPEEFGDLTKDAA